MEKKKILLIEDDESLRELYEELLKNAGYQIDSAEDGTIGLNKLQLGGWDLVLSDMILPGISGLELIRRAKKESSIPPAKKIVFLSNMYTEDQEKEALELGDGYWVKVQLTPENFLDNVKKYLESK